ncbi:hypothetical protein P4O66_003912 [Electrophorus voltai]|uniref:Uncharacterized protein n=1 Tax=Electrophorus voltai TaxID=2609070 RepID=A0AAD8ZRV9_9TELE|nr:hypothetical protein P4O66_003912 [Electrophorus voltai]
MCHQTPGPRLSHRGQTASEFLILTTLMRWELALTTFKDVTVGICLFRCYGITAWKTQETHYPSSRREGRGPSTKADEIEEDASPADVSDEELPPYLRVDPPEAHFSCWKLTVTDCQRQQMEYQLWLYTYWVILTKYLGSLLAKLEASTYRNNPYSVVLQPAMMRVASAPLGARDVARRQHKPSDQTVQTPLCASTRGTPARHKLRPLVKYNLATLSVIQGFRVQLLLITMAHCLLGHRRDGGNETG